MATTTTPTSPSQPIIGRKLDRRGFLVRAIGGLSLGFFLPDAGHVFDAMAADPTNEQLANAYIRIGADNSVTLLFGGCEMGQGTKTGLAQILAEELFVDWNQVIVQQSLVDPIVSYGTGGSSGVSRRYARLRNAGAACRELLILAAMDKTGDFDRNNYKAQSASVIYTGATPGSWTYGSLAAAAAFKTAPADLRLTDPGSFRLIGKSLSRVDIPAKVDGSAIYGIDVWFPNMVFAAIKHCPTFGGVMAKAPSLPSGAIAVVPVKTPENRGAVVAGTINAVAVVASNTWTAKNMANSLSVSWTLPASTANVDSAALMTQAQNLMAQTAGTPGVDIRVAEPLPSTTGTLFDPVVVEGQVNSVMGTPTLEANYSVPYVAHGTMEVLTCTASPAYSGTTLVGIEIWTSNQNASKVQSWAIALTGLAASAIKVNTTYLGGGLGRKIEQDYVYQAIQVALAVKRPVKLTWTREEDFTHDQYRPMALMNAKAKLDGSGNIVAWLYRTVTPSITGQRRALTTTEIDGQAVECARNLYYNLGTHAIEWIPMPAGIPVGYWRSVGASMHVFAVESFMDELAKAAGIDPFTFRYNHLAPGTRFRAVLEAADAMSVTWRNALPTGRAWGVAIGEAFGTTVCEVVEISQPAAGSLTVHRVNCVVDCGMAINPNSVEAQMQGGIVHGLNATLWGQTTFTAGKANQKNFNTNRVMRVNEMPVVTVKIMQNPLNTAPTGTGEPAVPPVAAAVANAYARLKGVRQRSLPFFPGATMGGL